MSSSTKDLFVLIEGPDAAEFADTVLENKAISNGHRFVDCTANWIRRTVFRNIEGNEIPLSEAVDLDGRCFTVRDEIAGCVWPDHRYLYVRMTTAMRSEGWRPGQLTPDEFIDKLRRRAHLGGLNVTIRY